MRPAQLLGILIYALILAGLATLHGALLALAIPLVVYLAAGLLEQPEEPQLSVTRSLSADRAPAGAPVTVRLSVTNFGRWPHGISIGSRNAYGARGGLKPKLI
jgi:uncharacterized protein (DUF58 family)